ncbi:hypothetical protein BC827DRAFT_1182285 [Russula dissimulans]|nr:hypothetical protein BC827DRAFT_1182285 [Russula dissimulans]
MRSSSRPAHRHPSHSHRTPSHPRHRFAFLRVPSAMSRFSIFNIIRASIYSFVFLWSIICLALAAHFQSVLSSSDLTRFVPFTIFVSSATLVIILVLSAFSVRRNMNPVSTRIELGCLGLLGTFWIALGAFLANSDSETADVECFVSASNLTPIDGGFSTETYQAQYRVLEALSLFNAILRACSSFYDPRSVPVDGVWSQFGDSCCSYLLWPSNTTPVVTKKSGCLLSPPLTGSTAALRRLTSCPRRSPRVALAPNLSRRRPLRRGDKRASSAHTRVVLHRAGSRRWPTCQSSGGNRALAPLTAIGLTITAVTLHPGGERRILSISDALND